MVFEIRTVAVTLLLLVFAVARPAQANDSGRGQ